MDGKKHCDFGPIFWAHLFYIILIYISPFWLDWRWMPLGVIGMYLQWYYFGGCFLTKLEFGESEHNNFNWYYLNRLGFNVSLKRVKIFTDYLIPIFLFVFAFVWQFILGHAAWL
ncbi:MAG: hypothetical protein A3B91_02285 [Candidatus Yanofskybacteria bacterium RIFCSPHIGHO2_02_FULL_41_29]|uniref:Uncharacterized protein n=1 Tax=Candidatus Yanofskybacteria bacterium RIFCSPHIGHO2_01_FULL_41_53 TaxID=1802663 RepID=A0A1F8EJU2_9BACT|nr:MAG: hypothetical protein A2650_01710 [Candidatus Yanofskybacteria bacterium RIFCSPHIGHO2_01_FULL_41_53]OGN12353.1 MAG: hypothetical protein A3B91_02285 [Candidatus Yanofskybacteria bacterium RIFCSPHIGHO2_02_FULL_41_29]OGN17210.1 MAG: hypothetical protein A3F48_00225 [Candidatus Yanofskybacteria bacterium RIFCSPHIGHO2_12_FULL_41_9]OGN23219.1 MAG: hypothetical protein A2916_02700 [Candidatus Yanofskybacteria bacterium RIFCSPLOWO2_01_FULL_41_67]OGN28884.1 MAG: hypothetical protein A3H54_01940 